MKRKFTSRWQKTNTLAVVAERIRPVTEQGTWAVDKLLKAESGLCELARGEATREHVSDLIASHNMTVALQKYKIGSEHRSLTDASSEALVSIAERFSLTGRYSVNDGEKAALLAMLDLHRAQLESSTVGQVQTAYEYAANTYRSSGARKLPSRFVGEPPSC